MLFRFLWRYEEWESNRTQFIGLRLLSLATLIVIAFLGIILWDIVSKGWSSSGWSIYYWFST